MGYKWEWMGRHWALRLWPRPYINAPYCPHRIIVIGCGRLDRNGNFHAYQPCCYALTLQNCCPGRKAH